MASGYDRIGDTEENINETTAILKKNVTKVMERGEKLDAISERSEQLERSANTFKFVLYSVHKNIIKCIF